MTGLISGQERVETDGTLKGSSTKKKKEVKKVLSVAGQLSALSNSLLSLTNSIEVGEKRGESDCQNFHVLVFNMFGGL